jgi:hypothetical protein
MHNKDKMRSIEEYGIIILRYILNRYNSAQIHGYDVTEYCTIIDFSYQDERIYLMVTDERVTMNHIYDLTSDLFIEYICIPVQWCKTSLIWRDIVDRICASSY